MTTPGLGRDASDELFEIASLASLLVSAADLDPLLERVGGARFVLLGEASHGTADYYRWRSAITQRLITEKASPSSPLRVIGPTASRSTSG